MRIIRQLGREDWIDCGLQILARDGEKGLRVEAAARELGVTKGSFYWHFDNRGGWCAALVSYWEHRSFADLARRRGPQLGPFGDQMQALDRALRDWARRDVVAALAWARVQRERALAAPFARPVAPRAA